MKLLNEKRYDELYPLMCDFLKPEDIMAYSNVFEIISLFTGGKLTTKEIFTSYDFLSDLVQNKHPEIAILSDEKESIPAAVRAMEGLDETRWRLTMEEKEAFAYCIRTCELYVICDAKTYTIHSCIIEFDSFEKIKTRYEEEKKHHPEEFVREDNKSIGKFGFSPDNPVRATSIMAGEFYLRKLRYNGTPVTFKRIGSTAGGTDGIQDLYELYYLSERGKVQKCKIYVDPYAFEDSTEAPEGFTLCPVSYS